MTQRKRPSDNTLQRVFAFVRHQQKVVQTHEVAAYYDIALDLARHILDVMVDDHILARTSKGYVVPQQASRRGGITEDHSIDSSPSVADAATALHPQLAVGQASTAAQDIVSYWLDRRSRATQDTIGIGDIEELVALLEGRFHTK